jgi:hypothetical protein
VGLEALDDDAQRAPRVVPRGLADQPLEPRTRVEIGVEMALLLLFDGFFAPRSVDGADDVGGGQAREHERHLLFLEAVVAFFFFSVSVSVSVVVVIKTIAMPLRCRPPSPRSAQTLPAPPEEEHGPPPLQ